MEDINTQELNKTVKTMGWYFSEKQTPTGLYATIGRIEQALKELNVNLVKTDESSSKLTKAINNITLAGVIIAGLSLLVAIGNLIVDYNALGK